MIYFVQAGARGPVKIGKAKDVAARIAILATGHYEPLSVLATIDGGRRAEVRLHRFLAAYRLRGEWFDWCPEVEAVVELARAGKLPAAIVGGDADDAAFLPIMDTIAEIAAELGAKPEALKKWRQRGVPHRMRLPIVRAAKERGIDLPDEAFDPVAARDGEKSAA